MLSFKQFLIEVQRTPARASNLTDYISKRQEEIPDYTDTEDPNYNKKYSKQMQNPISRHPHSDYEADIEETGYEIKNRVHTARVPIENIVSPQENVSVERVKEKINNPNNQEHGESILHNGKHILTNGNHYVASAILRGESHVILKYKTTSKIGN